MLCWVLEQNSLASLCLYSSRSKMGTNHEILGGHLAIDWYPFGGGGVVIATSSNCMGHHAWVQTLPTYLLYVISHDSSPRLVNRGLNLTAKTGYQSNAYKQNTWLCQSLGMSCFRKCIFRSFFYSRHLFLGVFILLQMAVCSVETINPLTPKIWLLILPSCYYTFPCELGTRTWC